MRAKPMTNPCCASYDPRSMTLQGVLQILRNDQEVTRSYKAEHVRHYRGRELAKAIERGPGLRR